MLVKRKFRVCRRLGDGIFNKCQTTGFSRSLSPKKNLVKKRPPRARSEYGNQLIEKQKVRYTYLLREEQFSNYVRTAISAKGKNSAQYLYRSLENRLDNVTYRAGFAPSRAAARQLVSHGHIVVNGKKITIPSYQLNIGDKITVRGGSRKRSPFKELEDRLKNYKFTKWLKLHPGTIEVEIVSKPDGPMIDSTLNLNSVVEFYSRT